MSAAYGGSVLDLILDRVVSAAASMKDRFSCRAAALKLHRCSIFCAASARSEKIQGTGWAPSSRSLRFTQRSAFDLGGRKSAKRHSMASYLFDFNSTGLRG